MPGQQLQELRDRLLAQQFLFDDPSAYRAGVYDAFDAVLSVVAPRDDASGRGALRLAAGFVAEGDGGGERLVGDAEGVDEQLGVGS